MKILFDHNMPKRFRWHMTGHTVFTTREMGWEALGNGVLLAAAAEEGFGALIGIDKNMEHQQNLRRLALPIIILDARSNALPTLLPFAPFLLKLLDAPLENLLYLIDADGHAFPIFKPRPKS